MFNVQFINIPVVAGVDIGRYLESLGLSMVSSGLYEIPPSADDNFARYLTGAITFVSGSGFWQGSGYALANSLYFVDQFSLYSSGASTGCGLASGIIVSGSMPTAGRSVGCINQRSSLFSDAFSFYPTGLYTGVNAPAAFLSGGLTQVGYTVFQGLATGYVTSVDYSGSYTKLFFWETWSNYPTGYQYNPVFISGITTTEIYAFTGYSGTNYYQTGVAITNLFGLTTGYVSYTGARPATITLFDAFESYPTGFYSGNAWNGAVITTGAQVTGSSVKTDNSDYTETFVYAAGSITILNSGTWFYDFYPESYRFINYSGQAG